MGRPQLVLVHNADVPLLDEECAFGRLVLLLVPVAVGFWLGVGWVVVRLQERFG